MMHMVGNPKNMQQNVSYDDLMGDILKYFGEKIRELELMGVKDIIVDPGFGFSKTLEQNYELLSKMSMLKMFGKPILAGVSRKSMIYKLLETTPAEALNGTTVVDTLALTQGAHILRVHDVRPAVEAVKIYEMYKR
jgi:dihydropteroate synthase